MDLYMSNVVTNKAKFKGITWGHGQAGGEGGAGWEKCSGSRRGANTPPEPCHMALIDLFHLSNVNRFISIHLHSYSVGCTRPQGLTT